MAAEIDFGWKNCKFSTELPPKRLLSFKISLWMHSGCEMKGKSKHFYAFDREKGKKSHLLSHLKGLQ